ncbi:Ccdc58 [Acrasis kona]|uniref:Ccdc58 n=1 Tax=Acrasis kona TaxID=1008807 RepID=A0AAW2Z3L8_9EUKA
MKNYSRKYDYKETARGGYGGYGIAHPNKVGLIYLILNKPHYYGFETGHTRLVFDVFGHSTEEEIRGVQIHLICDSESISLDEEDNEAVGLLTKMPQNIAGLFTRVPAFTFLNVEFYQMTKRDNDDKEIYLVGNIPQDMFNDMMQLKRPYLLPYLQERCGTVYDLMCSEVGKVSRCDKCVDYRGNIHKDCKHQAKWDGSINCYRFTERLLKEIEVIEPDIVRELHNSVPPIYLFDMFDSARQKVVDSKQNTIK